MKLDDLIQIALEIYAETRSLKDAAPGTKVPVPDIIFTAGGNRYLLHDATVEKLPKAS